MSAESEVDSVDADRVGPVLFVTGHPRSGTTLVSRMLMLHYDYGMGPEGHWIVPYAKRFHRFGVLDDDANARRLIEAVLSEEMFQIVRENYPAEYGRTVDVTAETVLPAFTTRTYPGAVYAVLWGLAQEMRRSRVGNKDPGFMKHLDLLEKLFPGQAKYLFVVRDGRDASLSLMQQPWGQKSWYANARFWADTCERYERFRSHIPEERLHAIHYEELLRHPERVSLALDEFLGQPLTAEARAQLVDDINAGNLGPNYGKWRGRMTPRQHRLFESVAGPWLERMGYERKDPDARAYAWERACYMTLEYARRAWYKARETLGFLPSSEPTKRVRPGRL